MSNPKLKFKKNSIYNTIRKNEILRDRLLLRWHHFTSNPLVWLVPKKKPKPRKTTQNNKCWWGSEDPETLAHHWWKCKMVQAMENHTMALQKLKRESPCDPAISLLDIYPKELKVGTQTVVGTSTFTAALFTIIWSNSGVHPQMGKKVWHRHAMEYFSVLKSKGILMQLATWSNFWDIVLSEIS